MPVWVSVIWKLQDEMKDPVLFFRISSLVRVEIMHHSPSFTPLPHDHHLHLDVMLGCQIHV